MMSEVTLTAYADYRPQADTTYPRLPAHWQVKPLKHVGYVQFSSVDKHSFDGEVTVRLCNYVDVYKHQLIRSGHRFMTATATPAEIERFTLRAGDVLLTKDSEAWNDIGVPALIAENLPGVLCGYHLAMVRPTPGVLLGEYLNYALGTPATATQFHVAASGVTRYGLAKADVKNALIPLPPLDEQAAIARYCAHLDATVSRLLRTKRRLIALLTEQKQAIIQHAVTRGLDPDAPLADSGVPWLGAVPAHWEVRTVRSCLSSVVAGVWGNDPSNDDGLIHIPCARVADFDMNNLALKSPIPTVRAITERDAAQRKLEKGDLLLEKSGGGDNQPVGRVVAFNLDHAAVCSNFVSRLRPNPSVVESRFLLIVFQLLQARRQTMYSIKQTTGIQNLDQRHYFSNAIPVPPMNEQLQIVEWIEVEWAALNATIDRVTREIDLIREYRTRLVADVVTGQLDVRAAAASLPDLGLDLDPLAADAEGGEAGEGLDDEGETIDDHDLDGDEDGDGDGE